MSEKAILTQEQADAIESISDKDYAINILALNKRPDHVLASLEMSEVVKALYVGYEVRREYEPGDKVFVSWMNGKAVRTVEKYENGKVTLDTRHSKNPPMSIVCHATPEEIYWLETLGREKVGDFRIGDIILSTILIPCVVRYDSDGLTRVSKSTALKMYENKELFSIYPADSENQLPQEEK